MYIYPARDQTANSDWQVLEGLGFQAGKLLTAGCRTKSIHAETLNPVATKKHNRAEERYKAFHVAVRFDRDVKALRVAMQFEEDVKAFHVAMRFEGAACAANGEIRLEFCT